MCAQCPQFFIPIALAFSPLGKALYVSDGKDGTVTVVDPADLQHSSMSYVRRAAAVTLIGLKLHVLAEGARFNLETREAAL